MGMRRKMAKGIAYAAAPKLAFTALNPKKAAFAKATSWAADRMMPHRRRSRANLAMKGIGAAAVALPLGVWLGRRFLGTEHGEPIRHTA